MNSEGGHSTNCCNSLAAARTFMAGTPAASTKQPRLTARANQTLWVKEFGPESTFKWYYNSTTGLLGEERKRKKTHPQHSMFRKWRWVCHLRWTLFGSQEFVEFWVEQLHTNVSTDSNEEHEHWLSWFLESRWISIEFLEVEVVDDLLWIFFLSEFFFEYFCMLESIVGHNVTTHSRCIHIGCVILWVGILKCGHSSLFKKVVACFVKIEMKADDRLFILVCCSNMNMLEPQEDYPRVYCIMLSSTWVTPIVQT